ncbi:protein-tyrosine phosphatase-like protein [Sphaerosporella brunnea]|uniref:Protein-tyrosine phosphatase-like protein n=1 Tax=Sphaerosporella brunnea TaxID=1250544 RepID=A0A5J5ELG5_9PEZI|nr:protein-tyrosine phosphatase-like protein [Sphaerosporella brunnea]
MHTQTAPPSFDSIYNFRDLGASINAHLGTALLKEGLLFRSGRLDDATASDRQKLVETYKLATVVDLRTKSEHIRKAQLAAQSGTTSSAETSPPWKTVRINFLSRAFELHLLLFLPWYKLLYFLLLTLLGLRIPAVRVIASNVICKKGLTGITLDSLRYCQPEILQALEILSQETEYPVLVHCTQGKDRTGLLAVLVCVVLEVPLEAVVADYVASNEGLRPVREQMWREAKDVGLDEDYLKAPEKLVAEVVKFLEAEFGGVEAYLDGIGFGKAKREDLRRLLVA